jgi:hypothetical protein
MSRKGLPIFGLSVLAATLVLSTAAVAQDQANTGVVPDAQVEANVLRALASAPELSTQNIQSSTVYGTVTLTGNVHDEAMRTRAENLAARAPGVKKVVDELTLGDTPAPADQAANDPAAANQAPASPQGGQLQSDGGYAPAPAGAEQADNQAPPPMQNQDQPYTGQPQGQPQQPGYAPQGRAGQQGYPQQSPDGGQYPGGYGPPQDPAQAQQPDGPPQGQQPYGAQPQPGQSQPQQSQQYPGSYGPPQGQAPPQPGAQQYPGGYGPPSDQGQAQPYGAPAQGQQPYGTQGQPPYAAQGQQPYGPPAQRRPLYNNGAPQAYDNAPQQAYAPPGGQQAGIPVTVPAGSMLRIRINRGLDSNHIKPGTPFDGTVLNDVSADNAIAIPRGATVQGTVIDAQKAHALSGRGEISLQINSVTLGGVTYPLNTELWEQKGRDKSTSTVNSALGLGALGAIFGAVAGGGAGAAIGAAAGGAVGVAGSASSPNGRVIIPPEAVITFRVAEPAVVKTVSEQEMARLAYSAGPARQQRPPMRRYYSPYYGYYYAPY